MDHDYVLPGIEIKILGQGKGSQIFTVLSTNMLGPFCSWGLSVAGAFLQLGPFWLGPFCRLPAASPGGG